MDLLRKNKKDSFKKEKFKKGKSKFGSYYIAPDFVKRHIGVRKIYDNGLIEHNDDCFTLAFSFSYSSNNIDEVNDFMNDLRISDCVVRFINDLEKKSHMMVISFKLINLNELNERIETIKKNLLYSAQKNNITINQIELNDLITKYVGFLQEIFDIDDIDASMFFKNISVFLKSIYDSKGNMILDNESYWFRSDITDKYYLFASISNYPYKYDEFESILSSLDYIKFNISEMTPISDYNLIRNFNSLYAGYNGLVNRIKRNNKELYDIYLEFKKKKGKFNDSRKFCYISKLYLIEADSLEELEDNFNSFKNLLKSAGFSVDKIFYNSMNLINVICGISNKSFKANSLIKSSEVGKLLIPYEKNIDDMDILKNYFMN